MEGAEVHENKSSTHQDLKSSNDKILFSSMSEALVTQNLDKEKIINSVARETATGLLVKRALLALVKDSQDAYTSKLSKDSKCQKNKYEDNILSTLREAYKKRMKVVKALPNVDFSLLKFGEQSSQETWDLGADLTMCSTTADGMFMGMSLSDNNFAVLNLQSLKITWKGILGFSSIEELSILHLMNSVHVNLLIRDQVLHFKIDLEMPELGPLEQYTTYLGESVHICALHPLDNYFASFGSQLLSISETNENCCFGVRLQDEPTRMTWHPDGKLLAMLVKDSKEVSFFDIFEKQIMVRVTLNLEVVFDSLCFFPTNRFSLLVFGKHVAATIDLKTMKVKGSFKSTSRSFLLGTSEGLMCQEGDRLEIWDTLKTRLQDYMDLTSKGTSSRDPFLFWGYGHSSVISVDGNSLKTVPLIINNKKSILDKLVIG